MIFVNSSRHDKKHAAILRSLQKLALMCALYQYPVFAAPAPSQAASAGYTINTFTSNFTIATVDMKDSRRRGFKWYLWDLFNRQADHAAVRLNADGSVTLLGDTTGATGELVTAVQYRGTNSFVGTSFSGGAYIEAELKFDPRSVSAATVQAWPAFWALPLEGNIIPKANEWKGQPSGYVHTVETDFFEAIRDPAGMPPNSYGGSMHDWYGVYNKSCGHGLCQVAMPYHDGMRIVPVGTDFTQYHRFGFLWVPATVQTAGYAKFYFDGRQVGKTQQWRLFEDQPPPPTGQPWAFGVLDRQHMFLILGTGVTQPMTVRSVNVWQAHTASNSVN